MWFHWPDYSPEYDSAKRRTVDLRLEKPISPPQKARPIMISWMALVIGGLIWGNVVVPARTVSAANLSDNVSQILRERLTVPTKPKRVLCRKEYLCGPNVLHQFYADRGFQPAWSDDTGPLPQAAAFVTQIHTAHRDGLRPSDYHLANIETLLAEIQGRRARNLPADPDRVADLELLLTDAFLLYGSHFLTGHVNPETIQSQWLIEGRAADLAAILRRALNADEIEEALASLRPQHVDYTDLKEALSLCENRMIAGEWPQVPPGPNMEEGDQGHRVTALRSRLVATNDLDPSLDNDFDHFNEGLKQAVLRFQRRHGLKADGIVGPETLRALNVPIGQRVSQLRANLERWRWLPQDLGRRYILVNIANFELDVVEDGQIIMTMRVVVGRRYRRTPVFTDTMTYMELNPYWHVPPRIAVRDIVPQIQKDPEYLGRKKIRVFESWDDQAPEIQPESIDWTQATARDFPFKLRQEPGSSNALGRVKFMFPNKFNVYLHDTPAQDLFQKVKRTFSSGCIRVERPIDLAEYLLREDSEWTRDRIADAIEGGETQTVSIPKPLPVHLLYWTAWVDSEGTVHFRDDIYGRDKRLIEALNERPPAP
jgi:murein L,D-transpeptidase YcbB/YkuD